MSDLFETVRVQSLAEAAHTIAALRTRAETAERRLAEGKAWCQKSHGQNESCTHQPIGKSEFAPCFYFRACPWTKEANDGK